MGATIVVIAAVLILQIAIALIGFLLVYALGGTIAAMSVNNIVTIVLNAMLYAVVAGGAAYIARTPTGRLLGIVLPMLAWLLSTAFWYGLIRLLDFYNPAIIGFLSSLFLMLVLAGWGCAAWTGRRWLIGLPITYVLLLVGQFPVSLLLAPAIALDNIATAQIMTALSGLVTTLVLVLGGVICWLFARSEQAAK